MRRNMKTANRGQWSEFYAFVYCLTYKRTRDLLRSNLRDIKYLYRKDGINNTKRRYTPLKKNETISIDSKRIVIPHMENLCRNLLEEIKQGKGHSFPTTSGQHLLNLLKTDTVNQGTGEPSDFFIQYQNADLPIGIDVKSALGGNPGILNASPRARLLFRLNPIPKNIADLNFHRPNYITGQKNHGTAVIDNISTIYENGGEFKFITIPHEIARKNIGTDSAQALSEIILTHFSTRGLGNIDNIIQHITKKHPEPHKSDHLKMLIKDLLRKKSLGMNYRDIYNPSRYQMPEGFLIVNKSGSVYFDPTNESTYLQHLYDHSVIDTASTRRHEFGYPYQQGEYRPSIIYGGKYLPIGTLQDITTHQLHIASAIPIPDPFSAPGENITLTRKEDGCWHAPFKGKNWYFDLIINTKVSNLDMLYQEGNHV